jgi:hypothetical protein
MKKTLLKKILFAVSFVFTQLQADAANYYWVGGSGNWSSYATHWATTSGGNVFHTQVPTSFDNVYFDANSFTATGQFVMLDTTIGYCQDMDWTGALFNPTFEAAVSTMQFKIFGSLKLTPAMLFTFNGKLFFTALTTGKIIETFSQVLPCEIEFVGPGGEWTLQDSLTTTKKITLTYGVLRSNNQNIRCKNFISDSGNYRALYLGTSVVSLYEHGYSWRILNSMILDADSSIIKIDDGGIFYSEGHTYNILEWDSTAGGYDNMIAGDNFSFKKIISKNSSVSSSLEMNCQYTQVDTIIARGKFETGHGYLSFYKYVVVNHDANFYSGMFPFEGDSILKMTVGGGASFQSMPNYIGNFIVQGQLSISYGYPQIFDTCFVGGNAIITSANNQLGMFTMTPGKTLTLKQNETQYIDSLSATGTPGFPIQIVSYDLGLEAYVNIQAPVCTDYLYIHAVHASGNPNLYVGTHSNDVANNTGWIFNNCITGFEESNFQESVLIYPNPSTTEIKLNFNREALYDVQFCNTVGAILFQTTTSAEQMKIDVRDFPKGIYFVAVRDEENNLAVKKIVKM